MKLSDTFIIVSYFGLLIFAIVMLYNFYTCDNYNCKAFIDAQEKYPVGTKNYYIDLLNNVYGDGFWCFPYIGASILSFLSFWFLNIPNTLYNFGLLFFVSFCVIYFTYAYLGHHHIKAINDYIASYIADNCNDNINAMLNNNITNNDNNDNNDNIKKNIPNYFDTITMNTNYS
jgi:hypothetical protein